MRFRLLLILFLPLFFAYSTTAQDILSKDQDSFRYALQQAAKNFRHWQDSINAVRIKKEVEQNGKSLDAFLEEMKEREKSQKRRMYIRIAFGALFLIVLVLGLARRRKQRNNSA